MGMDRDADFTLKATGNVSPFRFIKMDTSADNACAQAGSNDRPIGISGPGSRYAPGTAADDGFLAISGEPVPIYGPGRKPMLELGGTVTRGDLLKSDANGKGVTASGASQEVGARAMVSGVSGQFIKVLVELQPAGVG